MLRMLPPIIKFIEDSKTQEGFLEFLSSSSWFEIEDKSFHNYRTKIVNLVNKFQKHLERKSVQFSREFNREGTLEKTARVLRKRYQSKDKKDTLVRLLYQEDSEASSARAPSPLEDYLSIIKEGEILARDLEVEEEIKPSQFN